MLNDMISCFGIAEAPHGGFKQSGIGRTHGEMGLREMVQTKYVDVDLIPRIRKVWWFGYGKQYQRADERTYRSALCRKLGEEAARRPALRRIVSPLDSNLRRTVCPGAAPARFWRRHGTSAQGSRRRGFHSLR